MPESGRKTPHNHMTIFFGKHKGEDLPDVIFTFISRLMHMVSSRKTAVELTRLYYSKAMTSTAQITIKDILKTYNDFRDGILEGISKNQEWNLP